MASEGEKRPAEEIELTEDQVDAWLSSRGQKRVQTEEERTEEKAEVVEEPAKDADGDVEVTDAPAEVPITRQGSSIDERTRSRRPEPKDYRTDDTPQNLAIKGFGFGAAMAAAEEAPAADVVDLTDDVEIAEAPAEAAPSSLLARQSSSVAERTRSQRPEPKNYIAGAQEKVQRKLVTNFRGFSAYGVDSLFGPPAGAETAPAESAEERLARIETEAAELKAQLAAREAEKEAAASGSDHESGDEGPEDEYENNNSDAEDEVPEFEPLADDSTVAVAYGSVFSKNRRRWFAATTVTYDEKKKKYIVKWKSVPKGGRATFLADSGRVKAVSQEDYDAAPEDGVSFIGFHRQSTFAAPSADQDLKVGDPIAVAYGGQKTVAGVAGKFLWYTARVVGVSDDKYTVQWKFPASRDRAQFQADKDKVQPITETEFSKARKNRGKKVVYGFIGYRRLESSANLSSISKTDA